MLEINLKQQTTDASTTGAFINLGAGNTILPAPRPEHHALVDEAIYLLPEWVNVDRNAAPGIDEVVDLFRYPWPWADDSFGGALCSHICEHIPHGIRERREILEHGLVVAEYHSMKKLSAMQDGWFAWFSELYRVLQPGAIAHILFPHGRSEGGMFDPTHTRYLTANTFYHSLTPEPGAPFDYARDCNLEVVGAPRYIVHQRLHHLLPAEGDSDELLADKQRELAHKLMSEFDVATDVYIQLRVVK